MKPLLLMTFVLLTATAAASTHPEAKCGSRDFPNNIVTCENKLGLFIMLAKTERGYCRYLEMNRTRQFSIGEAVVEYKPARPSVWNLWGLTEDTSAKVEIRRPECSTLEECGSTKFWYTVSISDVDKASTELQGKVEISENWRELPPEYGQVTCSINSAWFEALKREQSGSHMAFSVDAAEK